MLLDVTTSCVMPKVAETRNPVPTANMTLDTAPLVLDAIQRNSTAMPAVKKNSVENSALDRRFADVMLARSDDKRLWKRAATPDAVLSPVRRRF